MGKTHLLVNKDLLMLDYRKAYCCYTKNNYTDDVRLCDCKLCLEEYQKEKKKVSKSVQVSLF